MVLSVHGKNDITPSGFRYGHVWSFYKNVMPSAFTVRCIGGQIGDQARRAEIIVDDGIDTNATLKGWHYDDGGIGSWENNNTPTGFRYGYGVWFYKNVMPSAFT